MCIASAVFSTPILRNIWGPGLDTNDPNAGEIPNGEVVALVPAASEEVTASVLPSEPCLFFLPMIRDGRRWILDSSVLCCWTSVEVSPMAVE